jgi:hypothetical protein
MKRIQVLVAFLVSALALPSPCVGSRPHPLAIHLDKAEYVVVGTLKSVTVLEKEPLVEKGEATVTVEQPLKGNTQGELRFQVVVADRSLTSPALHRVVPAIGYRGIWIVSRSATGYEGDCAYGCLATAHLEMVKEMLDALRNKVWSQPKSGLAIWVMTTTWSPDFKDAVIVSALKNVSTEPIFYVCEAGVVTVTVVDESRRSHDCNLYSREGGKYPVKICRRIEPGGVAYLEPDDVCIDLRWKVPPGKYEVTVSYESHWQRGSIDTPASYNTPVTPWQGRLTAKPVTLVVERQHE